MVGIQHWCLYSDSPTFFTPYDAMPPAPAVLLLINSLTTKKADDKIFARKFSKNVKSKLYHIEH